MRITDDAFHDAPVFPQTRPRPVYSTYVRHRDPHTHTYIKNHDSTAGKSHFARS